MAGTESKKRDRTQLDDLAVEAARLFYEQRLAPQAIFDSLVARHYDVRSPRDVRSLLERARDPSRPLVDVRVTRARSAIVTDEDLAEDLVRRTLLHRAIVAKVPASPQDHPASSNGSHGDHPSPDGDELHRFLGIIAARHLWSLIRSGDRIGIGPGRGAGFTVQSLVALAMTKPREFEDLSILSLTGGIMRHPVGSANGNENLDADDNAERLAEALSAELCVVKLPLFLQPYRDDLTRDDIIAATQARYLLDSGSDPPLTVALFGLDVLDAHHYLMRTRDRAPSRSDTRVVAEELDELRTIILHYPEAVLDVCVRFLVGTISGEAKEKVQSIVRNLNSKVVSISPASLNIAQEKIVVAGGANKWRGILSFISHPHEVVPTTLVTDEWTARRLLGALSAG